MTVDLDLDETQQWLESVEGLIHHAGAAYSEKQSRRSRCYSLECHRNSWEEKMIKRTSLVWKRPRLSDAEFRRLWLGEHVAYAKQLPGLREYIIDFVTGSTEDGPAGIATLRFDSRQVLDAAFSDPRLSLGLLRTRAQFARSVQVMFVDEEIVVSRAAVDKG